MTGFKVYLIVAPAAPDEIQVRHPNGTAVYVPKGNQGYDSLQKIADLEVEIRYLRAELKLAKRSKSRS